jgi:uncharacterized membrane protein
MRAIGWEQSLCAMSAASIAVLGLAYGDFAPAWHRFPAWLPGQEFWVTGLALMLLAASAGLFVARARLASQWAIGAYYAIWAVIASAPILTAPLGIGAWYGTMEALTALVGTLLIIYAPRLAQIVFGLTCVFYGWSHFAYANYTAAMVPSWLPAHLPLAYFTGACHIGAGLGLIADILPRLAATLEAAMMSLFGLLVWVPSFMMDPKPKWAEPPQNQWSELVVNVVLAAAAWMVAVSLKQRPWGVTRAR